MKKIILLFFILILLMGCTNQIHSIKYCESNSDCIPNSCCHSNDTVNKDYAPNCTTSLCTASCEGPLDCNSGTLACENNTCVIEKNA